MIVRIKYVGVLTSIISNGIKRVEAPEGTTIEEIIDRAFIKDEFDDSIRRVLKSSVFLVNKSKADKNTVLKDGDELMILNALGGG